MMKGHMTLATTFKFAVDCIPIPKMHKINMCDSLTPVAAVCQQVLRSPYQKNQVSHVQFLPEV